MNHSLICGRAERFFSSSKMLRLLCDPSSLLLSGYCGGSFLKGTQGLGHAPNHPHPSSLTYFKMCARESFFTVRYKDCELDYYDKCSIA